MDELAKLDDDELTKLVNVRLGAALTALQEQERRRNHAAPMVDMGVRSGALHSRAGAFVAAALVAAVQRQPVKFALGMIVVFCWLGLQIQKVLR